MSDWDASSDEDTSNKVAPAAALGRRRFDDEDVEDEVKDDWEEEDEEKPAPAPLAPAKKKGTLKQKLAEKEAAERRRQELGLGTDDEDEEEEEDPAEKRRREKDAQLKADLENARNLLGTSKLDDNDPISQLRSAKPVSKEDWEKLSTQLFEQLIKPQTSRAGFDKNFAPHLILLLTQNMRDTDLRLTGNKLRDLAEKKAKAEKEAKKAGGPAKKPKPKNVSTASAKDKIDLSAYGDEALDDDLDFM